MSMWSRLDFEWTEIDGFIGKEAMSHGHIFGRFMLPQNFFLTKLSLMSVAAMEELED